MFFFGGASAGDVVPQVVASQKRAGVRRTRRAFVDLDGQRIEVSGYEEAEKLFAELKRKEKYQEVDRKKLTIAVKKYEVDLRTRGRKPEKPEVIEQRMDDRAEKIAQLYAAILRNLEEEISNDDEEVLLLS